MMVINASHDMLNNSNFLAFLHKCDTINLLKVIMQFSAMSNLCWMHFIPLNVNIKCFANFESCYIKHIWMNLHAEPFKFSFLRFRTLNVGRFCTFNEK